MDRRQPHRNSDVARAVRKTRDRLAQQAGNPDFHREMLKLHAHSMLSGAFFIPALIVLVFISGLAAGMGTEMLLWSALALACLSPLLILSRRYNATDASLIDPKAATRNYLIAHVMAGLGWAFFGLMGCTTCMVDQFHVVKAVTLLLAMAATAILTASLSGALIATFALPVLAYAWGATWPASPVEMMMLALLIIALPFLSYVANHLKHSSVMMLSFRSQKDALIAELETAKAMSDEARHRAEEANLAKSRFLASMSHELRTPLNAILGFSEVMANEVLGPVGNKNYREYAGDIHDSGQHLLNLINEILDLSRIEAGRYQLQEEAVILPVLAEDACHMMELRARNKGIRIVQQFEPTLPRLYADERAIRQILLNLLSNAIKFTSSGGEIRVRVGWTAGGGQYISVKDNGTGIPQDEIPVVLSAFGQGTIAIKSAEQGTGLGLPIVQGLIAMHGGEFELHSRLREGTEAIAIFPPSRVMEELPAMPTKVAANAGW